MSLYWQKSQKLTTAHFGLLSTPNKVQTVSNWSVQIKRGHFFNFYIGSLQMEETEKPTRTLLEGMTSNKRDKNALIGVGSLHHNTTIICSAFWGEKKKSLVYRISRGCHQSNLATQTNIEARLTFQTLLDANTDCKESPTIL